MNDAAIYKASADYLHATTGYTEMRKKDSYFMWFLNFFVRWFNPTFMENYHTTVFGRIYWADGERQWSTLWHECVHRRQAIRVREPWFSMQYMFPQVLAAPGVLTVALLPVIAGAAIILWSAWPLYGLLGLISLVFLAPLPAPWRVKYEREAYLITAVCHALQGWDITSDWYLEYQVEHHCGMDYYKPSWWRARTRRQVRADIAQALRIVSGDTHTDYTDELIRIVTLHS